MFGRTERERKHSYKVILGTVAVLVLFPKTYIMIKSRVDGLGGAKG